MRILETFKATGCERTFDPAPMVFKKDKKPGGFQFVPVSDLNFREPEFVVADLLETDTLAMLFGDPGCGKSFIAVDVALSVATGASFHGRDTRPGAVFYIAGEGHNGLARRFAAWAKARGVSIEGAPLFVSNRPAQFLDAASARDVSQAVRELADEHGAPGLIVVDTVARNFGAGDENSTQDMAKFVAAMDDLKASWAGCTVMLIHHSGHADKGRARGAMALKGALDAEFRAEKRDGVIELSCTKMKDAPPTPDALFRLETVVLSDRADSAVLVQDERKKPEKRLTAAQRLAMRTFTEAAQEHGRWSDGKFAGLHRDDWRPIFYASHTADNDEAKRKAFDRARSSLVDMGQLIVEDDVYRTTDIGVNAAISIGTDRVDGKDMSGQTEDLSKRRSGEIRTDTDTPL